MTQVGIVKILQAFMPYLGIFFSVIDGYPHQEFQEV